MLTFPGITGTVHIDGQWLVIRRDTTRTGRLINQRLEADYRAPFLIDLSMLQHLHAWPPRLLRPGWVRPVVVRALQPPRVPRMDPWTVMFGVHATWQALVDEVSRWLPTTRAR